MKAFLLFNLLLINFSLAAVRGEVKILYPCDSLKNIPHEKEEKGTVTFVENTEGTLYQNGLILRIRKSAKEQDITIKSRWEPGQMPKLDPVLFDELSGSLSGELKCEIDMNFDEVSPHAVDTCSFKSPGVRVLPEFDDFLNMIHSTIGLPVETKEVMLNSISWKIPSTSFPKKPDLEMWLKNGECLLEASTKFESQSTNRVEVLKAAKNALMALKKDIKAAPSARQISKTAWALGLQE